MNSPQNPVNHQGGEPVRETTSKVAPGITRGDRRDERFLEADSRDGERVAHLVKPDEVPGQMVSRPEGARPDPVVGDVLVFPEGAEEASVWEAVEGEGVEHRVSEDEAREDSVRRAAADGGVGAAEGQNNLGGGPGGR